MRIRLVYEGRTTGEDPEATGHRVARAIIRGSTRKNPRQVNPKKSLEDVTAQADRIGRKIYVKHGLADFKRAVAAGKTPPTPEEGAVVGREAEDKYMDSSTNVMRAAKEARLRRLKNRFKKGENEG